MGAWFFFPGTHSEDPEVKPGKIPIGKVEEFRTVVVKVDGNAWETGLKDGAEFTISDRESIARLIEWCSRQKVRLQEFRFGGHPGRPASRFALRLDFLRPDGTRRRVTLYGVVGILVDDDLSFMAEEEAFDMKTFPRLQALDSKSK